MTKLNQRRLFFIKVLVRLYKISHCDIEDVMVVKDKKIGTAKCTEEATKHMARPSRWDEYETALLVEAYIKVTENGGMKTRVLQELSDNLRQMAVNKGIEIDDVYRNLNGMMWQYTFIEKAFKKSGFGQHFPAKVFRYVVKMYLYNRKKFDEILKEAKKRIDPSDVRASIDEYVFQKEMRMILQRHYAYGYRINSSIELNRFKNFAEMDSVVLPDSDERIKAEIRNVGYLIEDKVYIERT